MKKVASLVVSRPGLILAITLAVTAFFSVALAVNGVHFNSAPETLARQDDALRFFRETQATFQDQKVIIVALEADDVFTKEAKDRLDYLTARLASLPGVAGALSLANLSAVRRDEGGIVIENLLPQQASTADLERLKASVTTDPLYARHYVSTDGRTAAISVFLEERSVNQTRALAEEIERVVTAESKGDLWLAGLPLMDAKGSRSMTGDMMLLSPVAAGLCFLVFVTAFRSLWGALLPMLALAAGVIWTVGLMGMFGKPITIATLTLPVVLLAVGSSYIFHVLNQYRLSMSSLDADADERSRKAAWADGLRFILPAVLVSGLTTVAGFASLVSSPVPAAKDMGLFEATGVAFMLLLTLFSVPAALSLLPRRALGQATSEQGDAKDYAMWMNGLLKQITALILFRGRAVLTISIGAALVVGAGAYYLRVNTDYLKTFPRQSDVSQTAARLHDRLAGASVVQIVLAGEKGAATTPVFLRAVDSFAEFARRQQGVDAALSVADLVKKLNNALPGKAGEAREAIPEDGAHLRSIFDDYLSQQESLGKFVSADSSTAVILLRTNLFGSDELRPLTANLDAWARENLPANTSARITGAFILLNGASDDIAASQASSLVIALLTIYAMMVLLFRSALTGLLALLPNLLPIFGYFGFLGWAGIPLDITTSLVAGSVLGLAVDNAVHIIRRYRQSLAERQTAHGRDEMMMRAAVEQTAETKTATTKTATAAETKEDGWAMWLTMQRTGKPTALANLMLAAAFLLFTLSSFNPVRTGGMLWALTIVACLVADMVFLPALMRTKWFARAARGAPESKEPKDSRYTRAVTESSTVTTEKVGNR